MTLEYYPIELLHWCGMNDDCLHHVVDIVEQHPEYLNTFNNNKDNALMIATRTNNKKIVEYLVSSTNIDINYSSPEGNALHTAINSNDWEIFQILLEYNINIEQENHLGDTPLFLAAQNGNLTMFEKLIDSGANINKINSNNENILFGFIKNYSLHKNYYFFDLIINLIHEDTFFQKNKDNQSILSFAYKFQKNTKYSPLIKVLEDLNR